MKYCPFVLTSVVWLACGPPQTAVTSVDDKGTYVLATDWPQLPDSLVLGDPTGLGLDGTGQLWVFCRGERQWLTSDTTFTTPIATDAVLMLDHMSGRLLKSWGADRFVLPHGLTVDQHDRLWLTDCALHQVFCFSANGELLLQLGEARVRGADSAHFDMPTDVAVATDGSFYVADGYGNSRVVKFDSAGHYLFEWGTYGADKGQFNTPHAIDLDSTGNVYVADRENHRVQVFSGDGTFLRNYDVPDNAGLYSVCIDPARQGMIAVDYLKRDTTILGSTVWISNADGKTGLHFGRTGHYNGTPCRYHDVCVDAEGSIYVGDILGDRLQKWVRRPGSMAPTKASH